MFERFVSSPSIDLGLTENGIAVFPNVLKDSLTLFWVDETWNKF